MAPAVAAHQKKKPIGERALGLVCRYMEGFTALTMCFDEARSPVGSDSQSMCSYRVTKPIGDESVLQRF